MQLPPPPTFANDEAYEASLRDPAVWEPYARAALRTAGLDDAGEVRTHFPTTHVAALVGGRYLVKLHFEDRFGEDCFQTEREAYRMLEGREIPVPRLLGDGAVYPDAAGWRWPFLVMTAMPGASLRDTGASADRLGDVAAFVGSALRALHDTPVVDGEYVSFALYEDLIATRMSRAQRDHEAWGSLPQRLLPQIREYLRGADDLIDPDRDPPAFLHGHLDDGNVFVRPDGPVLRATGIVDFNDVYEGDRHYDLVAIHVKALACDKSLLRRVLDAYGWPALDRRWPRRMMALTLVHDYDMVRPFADRIPAEVQSLDDLAALVWDLDAPDLPTA